MKSLRVAGIPALLVLCVGMAICQDAAHDLDKSAAKTGQVVKHAGKKVGHATKSGVKGNRPRDQGCCQGHREGH